MGAMHSGVSLGCPLPSKNSLAPASRTAKRGKNPNAEQRGRLKQRQLGEWECEAAKRKKKKELM